MNFASYNVQPFPLHFAHKVVEVQHYMPVVHNVLSQVPQNHDGSYVFDVSLVPEPDNPNSASRHAISVRFHDRVIGYFSEHDAERYWNELAIIRVNGLYPTTKARLLTRGDVFGSHPEVDLAIAMRVPGLVIPANEPPLESWALLPWGDAIQVTNESAHIDQLRPYLVNCTDSLLLVSLHAVAEGSQPQVEVRLDGTRVGELTNASSSQLIPALDHLAQSGLAAMCHAQLTGSQFGAQLTLYVARGYEMGAEVRNPQISPLGMLRERTSLGTPNAWQGDTTTPLPVPPAPNQNPPTMPFTQSAPVAFGAHPAAPQSPVPMVQNMANNVAQQNVFIGQSMPPYGSVMRPPQKDIAAAYALWLFLGLFGAHRFYLRDNVGGVIQLLTMGGFGIWWLVDIALIPGLVSRQNRGY